MFAALAIPIGDDRGVDADRAVVDEDVTVDLAGVDLRGDAAHERCHRRLDSAGMPMSRAKWLSVPHGSTPSAVPVPASTPAAALTLPSPPATTIAS